ncbi:MAG: hypothetical protein KGI91_16925 [Burkholderiales bacterium]|nr:hypothetical protein [Burkholderiales bacterium]
MTCEACTKAATNPGSGLYHANCEECQHRMFMQSLPLHLANLKGIPASEDRRAYIRVIEQKHKTRAADALKAAYLEWWDSRKAKA